jgi:hypothetical protein
MMNPPKIIPRAAKMLMAVIPIVTAPVRMSKRALNAFRTARIVTPVGRTRTGGGLGYG